MVPLLAVNLLLAASFVLTPLPNGHSTRVLPTATSSAAATSFRLSIHPRPRLNATEWLSQSLRRKRHILASATNSGGAASDDAAAASSYGSRVFAHKDAFMTSSTSIGSPPVGWTAIIDTGSDLIWRQCLPCGICNPTTSGFPNFDPSSSSSFSTLPCSSAPCSLLRQSTCSTASSPDCSYLYKYGDGSYTSGVLASDTLTIPDGTGSPAQIPSLVFGCGADNLGNFGGANGLIGLGRGDLSLTSQLGISRFSYCLQPPQNQPSKTSPLLLGDAAVLVPSDNGSVPFSTPLLQDARFPTFYQVSIDGIAVGTTDATIPDDAFSSGVIFDSGTTLTFLATAAYGPVLQLLTAGIAEEPLAVSDTGLDACYAGMPSGAPPLTFRFGGGAEMELPPENYIVGIGPGQFCIGLVDSGDAISIIGNVQQQNFHILYDTGANTLSFTKASCDTV